MGIHFNQLTPAEHERLSILFEECSEVIQIVGKIMRHGFESYHPEGIKTNRQLLEKELGDLKYATFMMCHSEDISEKRVNDFMKLKNMKIGKYLHHQDA